MARMAIAFLLCGACAGALPRPPPPPLALTADALDAFIRKELALRSLVGLSVAVAHEGKLILSRGYGKSALPNGPAVDTSTRFAIGSVTKQFVCALALQLAEEGKLSLELPVAEHFPEVTRARDVRLVDLFTHRSGYRDYYPLDFTNREMQANVTTDEVIRRYATRQLDFEPRTRYSYSNTGYAIAARVVEKVSGVALAKLLKGRIFAPLGLASTVFEPALPDARIATGYASFALGPPEPALLEGAGWLFGAAGIYSTAGDLVRWDLALVDGRVLKPASLEVMTRPRALPGGRRSRYACGLGVSWQRGVTVLRHEGAVAGFAAINAVVPETRSAVAVLSNLETHAPLEAIHAKILDALLPKAGARRAEVPRVAGPPLREVAKAWLRRFQTGNIDRALLGEEFSHFLTDARIRAAAPRLRAFGEPEDVEVEWRYERGGMEVSLLRFRFGEKGTLVAEMYRTPDGKIQELLWSRAD